MVLRNKPNTTKSIGREILFALRVTLGPSKKNRDLFGFKMNYFQPTSIVITHFPQTTTLNESWTDIRNPLLLRGFGIICGPMSFSLNRGPSIYNLRTVFVLQRKVKVLNAGFEEEMYQPTTSLRARAIKCAHNWLGPSS